MVASSDEHEEVFVLITAQSSELLLARFEDLKLLSLNYFACNTWF
jgi:hypothetical protein